MAKIPELEFLTALARLSGWRFGPTVPDAEVCREANMERDEGFAYLRPLSNQGLILAGFDGLSITPAGIVKARAYEKDAPRRKVDEIHEQEADTLRAILLAEQHAHSGYVAPESLTVDGLTGEQVARHCALLAQKGMVKQVPGGKLQLSEAGRMRLAGVGGSSTVYNTANFHASNSGPVLQGRDNLTQTVSSAGGSMEDVSQFLRYLRELLPALELPPAEAAEVADDLAVVEPLLARKKMGMVAGGVVGLWNKVGGKITEKVAEHAGDAAWLWMATQAPSLIEAARHLLQTASP
jgi:hypothetical protein